MKRERERKERERERAVSIVWFTSPKATTARFRPSLKTEGSTQELDTGLSNERQDTNTA